MTAQPLGPGPRPAPAGAGRPPHPTGTVVDHPALRLLPLPVGEPDPAPVDHDGRVATTALRAVIVPAPLVAADVVDPLAGTIDRLPDPFGAVLPSDDEPGDGTDEQALVAPVRLTPTRDLPEAGAWTSQFVQAAVEVATGLRPASQLVRWTSDPVWNRLARRCEVATRARRAGRLPAQGRARVRSVRTCDVRDGIVEACAVVMTGARARAVALRLEGIDGRWRVTVLELG